MSQSHSPTYTVVFVGVISLVSALLLSFTHDSLQAKIRTNEELEIRKNILDSLEVFGKGELPGRDQASAQQVDEFFKNRLTITIVGSDGKPVECNEPVARIKPWQDLRDNKPVRLPIFQLKDQAGAVEAVAFPIWGQGLWGAFFGYMAVEKDGRTVRGITFYSHKETPGLGAEMENPSWRAKWRGKTLFDADGKPTPVFLEKGGVEKLAGKPELQYAVDGISGATLTGKGITAMMQDRLANYGPYLQTLRGK